MKALRPLVTLLGLVSLSARGAAATDIHIIFDPSQPPQQGNFNLIVSDNVEYTVNWVTCNQAGFPSTSGFDACIGFINQTNQPLTSFAFQFTVPSSGPLVGQTLDCSTNGVNLTINNCSIGETLTAGEVVSALFTGGTPVPNNTLFFIGETGVGLSDIQSVPFGVTAGTTPEPASVMLLVTGLATLGLWGQRRRRVRLHG